MDRRSFEEILREKMGVPPANSSSENTRRARPERVVHVPFQDWSELLSPRKTSGRTVGFEVYGRTRSKGETAGAASEEPLSPPREKAEPPAQPQAAPWTFEQQLAIDQLIRMGAPLKLNSSYEEIKKAYRTLVHRFHPDRHQHLTEAEQRLLADKFRFVVEAFQLFEKAA